MATNHRPHGEGILASKVKLEKIEYLWHDKWVKGAIGVIGGPSGKGKSLTTAKIAADVTRGRGMPGKKSRGVIFSNREDAKSISRGRIEAAGGDLDKVLFQHYWIPDDIARLESDIIAHDAAVVILDTASKHITAPIRNDQLVAQALEPLQAMCERTGAVVIFVTHTLKSVSRSADPLTAIGGATGGLVGTARCVAVFGVHPDDPEQRGIAWVKNSYGPPPQGVAFSIEQVELYDEKNRPVQLAGFLTVEDAEVNFNPIDLIVGKKKDKEGNEPDKRDAAAEWLTHKLADGPVSVKQLQTEAEAEGQKWGTVRRAEAEIGIEKPRDGFGKNGVSFWRLPDGHPALSPTTTNKTPGGK